MGLVSGSKCPPSCQCQAEEVICTGTQLTEYPPDIPLNTRRLFLNNNSITYLPAMNLGLLSDLVYLDCRDNLISEVMDYTFIGVFRLLYLDLSSNNLSWVSPYSFSMLSNLVQLNISNNPHLLALNKYTFANTSSLRHLDLRNTGLQTLDHSAFQNLLTLQTLYLSGNPWKCNCSFLDFTIYLIVTHLNHPGEDVLGVGEDVLASDPWVPEKGSHKMSRPGRCGSVVECRPMHQEITGLIPCQGTCPGC
ncbi:Leucine-rich repeat-containing protein 52 [Myotis brandtii]|uniref:Leucine-rich repeat-containing protein 52 n=1 Tax=Myotis brandtii TaxID=109478 RepID=S7NH25_MYOBR|nr:Leucine-rich repeat-containing protein 52 [Myotis brandtii]